MNSGSSLRLGRMFRKESQRSFMVAIDHGLPLGPVAGLVDGLETVKAVAPAADAIFVTPGLLARAATSLAYREGPLVVLRTDLWLLDPRVKQSGEALRVLLDPSQAVRLGADAVTMLLVLGTDEAAFAENAAQVAKMASEAHLIGIPLIVEVVGWGSRVTNQLDGELLRYGCRVAAELGADAVKTPFPESASQMRSIVESAGVPVLVLGGALSDDPEGLIARSREALGAGARGLIYGRNVWQAPEPAAMAARLASLVHNQS